MYDIRQFRPTLYALVMLGMTGFAYALEVPGLWCLAMSAILINAWLVRKGRFRPMPRYLSNAVTVLGVLLLAAAMQQSVDAPIVIIGQFLVLLQIVKLYEQRANRDYAQVLVLNLLQMVAAAISTAALVFGIMLIVYLALAIYCCLLFHLKVETDAVKQALDASAQERIPPKHDLFPIKRSVRRLAGLMTAVGMVSAVLMFLFFPRGGASVLGPMQLRPSEALTGFSDSVSFQNVAMITQNTQTIAWVKISKDGQPFHGVLMLRGLTLNRYTGNSENSEESYRWIRTLSETDAFAGAVGRWKMLNNEPSGAEFVQQVTLYPTGTNVLFAIGGITRFKPDAPGAFSYSRHDEVLQASDAAYRRLGYEVVSRDRVSADPMPPRLNPRSRIDPKIEEFARLPEVSGTDEQGPLAARRPRDRDVRVSPLDSTIAGNIAAYLRANFAYTLDLTDARRIFGQDPLVAFLYDLKRGHCEYFAGAMTAMCQSLGMQARLVVGFRCDEYNPMFDYYNVRQSHAHAWVEVLNEDGVWETYDPTSSTEAIIANADSWWQRARAIFGYLEFAWENSVIAYDQPRQGNLLLSIDRGISSVGGQTGSLLRGVWSWWTRLRESIPWISVNILSAAIALIPLAFVIPVLWFMWDQWTLRRRAHRIGLDTLPATEQMKLARQLGFYDDLLRLLEHHRIMRPIHLTPLEFSDSLAFLPVDVFGSIRGLTQVFYRVRYGREELSVDEWWRLDGVIGEVATALGGVHE